MMTIAQMSDKIIHKIKHFPKEARQNKMNSGPKTSWDEYMEQVQYREYDSFEVFQDTIDSMVEDAVDELSVDELDRIFEKHYSDSSRSEYGEKRRSIMALVLEQIEEKAYNEKINYYKPGIKYIKYIDDELLPVVAKVLKQVSPEDYLIHFYSEETGMAGKQVREDLYFLDGWQKLETITKSEFEDFLKNLGKVK